MDFGTKCQVTKCHIYQVPSDQVRSGLSAKCDRVPSGMSAKCDLELKYLTGLEFYINDLPWNPNGSWSSSNKVKRELKVN